MTNFVPSWDGTGPSIRAANTLRFLSERLQVTLQLILHEPWTSAEEERLRLDLPRLGPVQSTTTPLPASFNWPDADLFVVFPQEVLFGISRAPPRYHRRILDLDEVKSARELRIASMLREAGSPEASAWHNQYAKAFRLLESRWFPWFDTIVVSSETELERLAARGLPARAEWVPNVRPPEVPVPPPAWHRPWRLLLAGALNYAPNVDAVFWMANEIMPALNPDPSDAGFVLHVVGMHPVPAIERDLRRPDIVVHGPVPSMRPHLEQCHIMVCPLRSGGGTRLKIVEAWNHGVPVVTTTIGREGLPGVNGWEFLEADAAEDFAAAVRRLTGDAALAARLRDAGRHCFLEHHTPAKLDRAWERVLA